ncbi:hypothetical protein GCM10007973_30290 [Polymorphobacter multimanifer]|uniref:hypothetical protein n=1 Tax=Polymorphobacter multimanifer TaxID=1070431 RepID=UPI001668B42F|nr:hypothetical protein [Polymorphobacter multimanifer]GGI92019.1 hypothetical protein GCM10007973_30290 [Polymorphobacter multimanifer]
MSELRIRSEAAAEMLWPENFLPPQAVGSTSMADTAPLVLAVGAAIERLLRRPVSVLPANFDEVEAAQEGGGQRLAALWLSLRLGGSMESAQISSGMVGATWARFRDQLLAAAAAAVPEWPDDLDQLAVLVTVGSGRGAVEDVIVMKAPAREKPPCLPASPALAAQLAAMPMRITVELASADMSLHALLPLHAGQVLASQPVREMRLRLGDHGIGTATLEPLPDGRQVATLLNIDVERMGERI